MKCEKATVLSRHIPLSQVSPHPAPTQLWSASQGPAQTCRARHGTSQLAVDICIHSMEKPNSTETLSRCSLRCMGRTSGKGKIWPISADLKMAAVANMCNPFVPKTDNIITHWRLKPTTLLDIQNLKLPECWAGMLKWPDYSSWMYFHMSLVKFSKSDCG